jgi:AcrR family transcriptional regulator
MAIEEPPRKLRADAARNRERVLEAAREVFAEHGVTVPIDDVARRAGVGVGTVYRHFPAKENLFEAILVDSISKMGASAREAAESEDPGPAFFDFLELLGTSGGENMALVDALDASGYDIKHASLTHKQDFEAAFAELLARAQEAGAVRADVELMDVLTLCGSACRAGGAGDGGRDRSRRLVAIVADGLRADAH